MEIEKDDLNQFKGKIWKGVFKNFKEAENAFVSESVNVWDTDIWLKKQLSHYQTSFEKFKKTSPTI